MISIEYILTIYNKLIKIKSMTKYNHIEIVEFAQKYGCEIINNNYITQNGLNKIMIKSRCGHISMETPNSFIKKKLGIYCKDCMILINTSDNNFQINCVNSKCNKLFIPNKKSFLFCSRFCSYSREKNDKTKSKISNKVLKYICTKEDKHDYKNIYINGNIFILNLIKNNFNFEITNRCCHYNHIIKPINISDQNNDKKWLPIEIKYSNSSTDAHYYFGIKKVYNNIIVMCVSLDDKNIWIFPPNSINYTSKLKINKKFPNKFEKYLVNSENLVQILLNYYNTNKEMLVGKNDNLMDIVPSLNKHVMVEYEYKKKRLDSIKFIDFQNPISNFETYNFIINNYKIQECVSYQSYVSSHQIVSVYKKVNCISTAYNINDNDFYWIHSRINNNFYVIPSSVMYEQGFLESDIKKGKITINIDKNENWMEEYKFNYDSINEEFFKSKLKNLFGIK